MRINLNSRPVVNGIRPRETKPAMAINLRHKQITKSLETEKNEKNEANRPKERRNRDRELRPGLYRESGEFKPPIGTGHTFVREVEDGNGRVRKQLCQTYNCACGRLFDARIVDVQNKRTVSCGCKNGRKKPTKGPTSNMGTGVLRNRISLKR